MSDGATCRLCGAQRAYWRDQYIGAPHIITPDGEPPSERLRVAAIEIQRILMGVQGEDTRQMMKYIKYCGLADAFENWKEDEPMPSSDTFTPAQGEDTQAKSERIDVGPCLEWRDQQAGTGATMSPTQDTDRERRRRDHDRTLLIRWHESEAYTWEQRALKSSGVALPEVCRDIAGKHRSTAALLRCGPEAMQAEQE
jgi:hypothetical protein